MRERLGESNDQQKKSDGRYISSDPHEDHSKPRDVNNFNTTVSIDLNFNLPVQQNSQHKRNVSDASSSSQTKFELKNKRRQYNIMSNLEKK